MNGSITVMITTKDCAFEANMSLEDYHALLDILESPHMKTFVYETIGGGRIWTNNRAIESIEVLEGGETDDLG